MVLEEKSARKILRCMFVTRCSLVDKEFDSRLNSNQTNIVWIQKI